MDVRSLVDGFLLDCKVTGKSFATISYYIEKLNKYLWYTDTFGLPSDIEDITPTHIREFLAYARTTDKERWGSKVSGANKPISPTTIKRLYACLRVLFNWSISEGLLAVSPLATIKPPKDAKHIVKALTVEQVSKCLSLLNGRDFLSIRNKAMLLVMVDTAIRLGELLSLTVDVVDLKRQVLVVNGKTGERYVRFGNMTAKALWKYLATRAKLNGGENALWCDRYGSSLSERGIAGIFKALGNKVGIKIHPHLLRHTGATLFLKNGGSPFECQYLLGHSSLEMTKRYCQSLGFEDAYKAHIKASPIDNLNKRIRA
ncbi:tyrosine-type recombinase/integrase [Chloroflexota bacterium]